MADYSNPSIREQIMEALKSRLETMTEGAPVSDPYGFTFGRVQRAPITSNERGKEFVAALFDVTEFKTPDTCPVVRSTLNVIIEFIAQVGTSEKPSTKMNLVLSEVERRIKEDVTFGSLAIDTQVTQSEIELDGRFDKTVEGALYIDISYRHNNSDPRAVV